MPFMGTRWPSGETTHTRFGRNQRCEAATRAKGRRVRGQSRGGVLVEEGEPPANGQDHPLMETLPPSENSAVAKTKRLPRTASAICSSPR